MALPLLPERNLAVNASGYRVVHFVDPVDFDLLHFCSFAAAEFVLAFIPDDAAGCLLCLFHERLEQPQSHHAYYNGQKHVFGPPGNNCRKDPGDQASVAQRQIELVPVQEKRGKDDG
jgi:hypothetical protein